MGSLPDSATRLTRFSDISAPVSEHYTLVTDPGGLPAIARLVASQGDGFIGLDLETTGLDPTRDRPRLLQLRLQAHEPILVNLFETGGLGQLGAALGQASIVGHNLAFDLGFLRHHFGVEPKRVWDTMLASQLIDAGQNRHAKGYHSLRSLVGRELGTNLSKDQQKSNWSGALSIAQLAYAASDVEYLLPLQERLKARISDLGLDEVMSLECEVLPAIVDMALAGVPINRAKWAGIAESRRAKSQQLSRELKDALGIEKLDSTQQVSGALQKLGINVAKTNAAALAPYSHNPEVKKLLDYRTRNSFCRGAGQSVLDAIDASPDGRVRGRFHQLGAPTGRMSMSEPNLLGLPKDDDIRDCVEAPPGFLFIDADYSTIELRVLAQVTGDARLLEAFRAGQDLHSLTASIVLGKPIDDVDKEERRRAKPVNFGFSFGMGAPRFSEYALKNYGVAYTEHEAARARTAFKRSYSGVATWQARTKAALASETRTASGRLRVYSPKDPYTERLNMPVQGTAADGMKAALVLLRERLRKFGARLLLCVHDQVLVEAPTEVASDVAAEVRTSMGEGMRRYVPDVPIQVEVEIKPTWKP